MIVTMLEGFFIIMLAILIAVFIAIVIIGSIALVADYKIWRKNRKEMQQQKVNKEW